MIKSSLNQQQPIHVEQQHLEKEQQHLGDNNTVDIKTLHIALDIKGVDEKEKI
jgi:hypothetical protein